MGRMVEFYGWTVNPIKNYLFTVALSAHKYIVLKSKLHAYAAFGILLTPHV